MIEDQLDKDDELDQDDELSEPWEVVRRWIAAVGSYGSLVDESDADAKDAEAAWLLTHPSVQLRIVDKFMSHFADLDELVGSDFPQYHESWSAFAPLALAELRAMLPELDYGEAFKLTTDDRKPSMVFCSPNDRPPFAVVLRDWRIIDVRA
jgi:hypothetical protein